MKSIKAVYCTYQDQRCKQDFFKRPKPRLLRNVIHVWFCRRQL